jgi:hypothetical protein
MADIWALVIRGYKNPLVVDSTSRIDEVWGELVPIPTWDIALKGTQTNAPKRKHNFIILLLQEK